MEAMRERVDSTSIYINQRHRIGSIAQPEISPTLLEIITIYEKIKKGHENEIYRLSKFAVPTPPAYTLLPDHLRPPSADDEDETIPLVPSFSSNLNGGPGFLEGPNNSIHYLDFNKYKGLPSRKYLYFSAETNMIQADSIEGLSPNYTALLKSDFYWLNITDPTEADLAMLSNAFNVHDFTLQDIRESNTEETTEFYQHYTFMSTKLLRESKHSVDFTAGFGNQNSMGKKYPSTISMKENGFLSGSSTPLPGPGPEPVAQPPLRMRLLSNAQERFPMLARRQSCPPLIATGQTGSAEPTDMDFNILIFKNFVITLHCSKWSSVNDILGFLSLLCGETTLTPDWVLYSIFIELTQDAKHLLGKIEPRLNELYLWRTSNTNEMSRVLQENYQMVFHLYTIQRFLKPKVNNLRMLKQKCGRRFGKIPLKLLSDISEEFVEMDFDLRNLNQNLKRSQDTFIALVSVEKSREANEMSFAMTIISQIALIFLPIQAISGFFGMNVTVPFQEGKGGWAFWAIVCFSAMLALIIYLSRHRLIKKRTF